ncbi:MAG: TetR/AcrR family transcriptional regulator, partial [Mycobacterium sp.]
MPGQKPDPTGAKILDGAIRVLGDFGFKRATIELVANYAGVSHMTIYRRWPTKNDLLKTAVVSELAVLLDTAFEQFIGRTGLFAESALEAFGNVVWAVQSHPIAVRELTTEPAEQLAVLSGASGAVMET